MLDGARGGAARPPTRGDAAAPGSAGAGRPARSASDTPTSARGAGRGIRTSRRSSRATARSGDPVPGAVTSSSSARAPSPARVRVTGGGDDPESAALRARAARLEHAPVVVPATDGVAVVGEPVLAGAVLRALVLQLCLALPPGELRIVGSLRGENAWAERLPHRRAVTGCDSGLVGPGEPAPRRCRHHSSSTPIPAHRPPGCAVVLDRRGHRPASRSTSAARSREIEVEAVGRRRRPRSSPMSWRPARHAAARARRRARAGRARPAAGRAAPRPRGGASPAVIGVEAGEPARRRSRRGRAARRRRGSHRVGQERTAHHVDPRALRRRTRRARSASSSPTSRAARRSTPSPTCPHVTGVITDLDGAGARRAIESLRAEVRWREAELARAGARDILDPRVDLPRLVIVVDEFAALLGEHPELHAVFTDVAARGRALGMHLVLGTQRAGRRGPREPARQLPAADQPAGDRSGRQPRGPRHRRGGGASRADRRPGARARAHARATRRRGACASRCPRRADVEAIAIGRTGPRPRRPWLPALPGAHRRSTELQPRSPMTAATRCCSGSPTSRSGSASSPVGVRRRRPRAARRGRRRAAARRRRSARSRRRRRPASCGCPRRRRARGMPSPTSSNAPPRAGTRRASSTTSTRSSRRLPARACPRAASSAWSGSCAARARAEILVVASAQRLTGARRAARRSAAPPPRACRRRPAPSTSPRAASPRTTRPARPPGRGRLDGRAVQVAVSRRHGARRRRRAAARRGSRARPLTGFVTRRSPADARSARGVGRSAASESLTLDEFAADRRMGERGRPVVRGGRAGGVAAPLARARRRCGPITTSSSTRRARPSSGC